MIVGLLAVYALMARTASNATSATFDEPLHLVSAYVIRHAGDFRMNPEDPPLFQRWVALVLPKDSLHPDYGAPEWSDVRQHVPAHWAWVNRTLYPPANSAAAGVRVDHVRVLGDARAMMLLVAVALGVATAWLGWKIRADSDGSGGGVGGGVGVWAGVLAAALFAFDPAVLGHGPLVKNDVALSLSFAVVAVGLVMVGKRVTWGGVAVLALGAGVGVATKFSGLLFGPFVVGILLVRAWLPWTWEVAGRELGSRGGRLAVAVGISAVCLAAGVGMLWAVYGFRYSYSPDPGARVDLTPEVMMVKTHIARSALPTTPPAPAIVDATPTPGVVRLAEWINAKGLLPETWAKGFIYTYGTTLLRSSFLMGEISELGWWYYFPAVLLFKMPLGTLALMATAGVVGAAAVVRFRRVAGGGGRDWAGAWPYLATGMLAGAYMLVTMSGSMNLGIRHLLPILPLVFALVAAGLAGRLMSPGRGSVLLRVWVGVALAGLAAESVASHNRYIAFFNVPSRIYGPEKLLADSNLDWGQDLPALADWQTRNPEVTLTLVYFGLGTPESHGIRYKPLKGEPFSWAPSSPNPGPAREVVALSATWLQEVYMTPGSRGIFSLFRQLRPAEVLNGTIFLYNWPPSRDDVLDNPMRLYWRTGDQIEEVPMRSALPPR